MDAHALLQIVSRRRSCADRRLFSESPEFVVASLDEAARAVQRFRDGPADFADYFLAEINTTAGCAVTATFDRDALKSGEPFAAVPTHA